MTPPYGTPSLEARNNPRSTHPALMIFQSNARNRWSEIRLRGISIDPPEMK